MLSHRGGWLGYLLLFVLCRRLSRVAPLCAFLFWLGNLSLGWLRLGLGLCLELLLLRNVLVWEALGWCEFCNRLRLHRRVNSTLLWVISNHWLRWLQFWRLNSNRCWFLLLHLVTCGNNALSLTVLLVVQVADLIWVAVSGCSRFFILKSLRIS
jgi:hypothetical protein